MEAFAATLEELNDADLLLHVVDATSPRLEEQIQTVEEILVNLDLKRIPSILLLNKTDLLKSEEAIILSKKMGGLVISALYPSSLLELSKRIEALIWPGQSSIPL
jgi:GTP-binding protein HflX